MRFGHAETLLPLQALLGLHKDEPKLRAGNQAIHMDRKFKTSKISPFSSNIMFVLFKCDAVTETGEPMDKYMVQMLHNEMPMIIPGCKEEFCSFATFKSHYQHILDTCDFEDICKLSAHEEL
jgi:multiple inositol-polyphosphate phosphatase/2,3-bisphosphoglycerate 3-phosphatase